MVLAKAWRIAGGASLLGALFSGALLLSACSGDEAAEAAAPGTAGTGSGGTGSAVDLNDPNRCVSNAEFFARSAYSEVFAPKCMTCHGPGGLAQQEGTDLNLLPPEYPGFIEENLATLGKVAANINGGTSILLRFPKGELEHPGGAVIAADSPEYATLEELVARLETPPDCEASLVGESFADVTMLDPLRTFRKAALSLNGRLPTATETQTLSDATAGEAALPAAIDQLFLEDAFYDRLRELWNDVFLTDRYLNQSNNILSAEDFPLVADYYEGLPEDQQNLLRRALAREPLDLIAYLVKNDLPFTGIVTADYTVMTPQTAPIFNNTGLVFQNGTDYGEFQTGKIYVPRDNVMVPFPHAGILTSPMWLNRFPTSPTNRNRHRAYVVLRDFLATDILRVASRPIDPTKAVNLPNPTREDPDCKTCHVVIDPVAGGFQHWDDYNQEQYRPDREWHAEMFAPGFGKELIQTGEVPEAWLAQHIAADKRFPVAMVGHLFKALMGRATQNFPSDSDPNHYLAWASESQELTRISTAFVDSGFNLKVALRELVLSPFFRAANATGELSADRAAQLDQLGTGHLLTPEALNRKITAVLGFPWNRDDGRSVFLQDYNLLYGGIDSDAVTQRLTQPNGIIASIAWRVANRVSCLATSWEFNQTPDLRVLLPLVSMDTLPEDELAQAVPANVDAIRQNIQHLYSRILGETVAVDGPEVDLVYNLFLDTWREGRAGLANDTIDRNVHYTCQNRYNPVTFVEHPEEGRLAEDPNYVIRSWMAVLTFFFADYRFLYE
jgi:mono/diheme cytochrome c family protein